LARWLVDRSNQLTARVTVNRFWQMLFGVGLVKTVTDFGSQGEWPANPELLDWLATEFMDSGWNVKAILKTMVMSATYRQSSKVTPALLEKDPENRLLARGPRFRLPAQVIRDQALAVSGLLVEKVGGPPVKPYQPPGLWEEVSFGDTYKPDEGAGLYRRSLYTFWKRTVAPPTMVTFDAADRETCAVRITRTNTPLQALDLMNDVTYLEASRKLAERMIKEGGPTPQTRIDYAFLLATARPPRAAESEVLLDTLRRYEQRYQDKPEAAVQYISQGKSGRDEKLDAADRETCAVRITRTNTPLQALDLMNDVTYLEASRKLAERMIKEGGPTPDARIEYAFRLATARPPRAQEGEVLLDTLRRYEQRYRDKPEAAVQYITQGKSGRDEKLNSAELAAYTAAASLILNLDETITKE